MTSIKQSLISTIKLVVSSDDTKRDFLSRVQKENVSREENPYTHFCVYFAAYDNSSNHVFIGHHRKSGLWLFNGGHMDKREQPLETLEREMMEEWGSVQKYRNIPSLLTVTEIEHPDRQICRFHYDIWYFILLDMNKFNPDENLLGKEFYQIGWKTMRNAKLLTNDPNTKIALTWLENL